MPHTADFIDIKLKILVFGPNPNVTQPLGFQTDLANKRQEIRTVLQGEGHEAHFPEDLMTGSVDPAIANIYLWEQLLVRQYDMVVHLVGTPGSIDEISLFHAPPLAMKVAMFFNSDHQAGLSYQHALLIEAMGAKVHLYQYPIDLSACNLMKAVRDKVWAVKIGKFYAP